MRCRVAGRRASPPRRASPRSPKLHQAAPAGLAPRPAVLAAPAPCVRPSRLDAESSDAATIVRRAGLAPLAAPSRGRPSGRPRDLHRPTTGSPSPAGPLLQNEPNPAEPALPGPHTTRPLRRPCHLPPARGSCRQSPRSPARRPGPAWNGTIRRADCETNRIGAARGAIPREAVRPTEGSPPADHRQSFSRRNASAERTQSVGTCSARAPYDAAPPPAVPSACGPWSALPVARPPGHPDWTAARAPGPEKPGCETNGIRQNPLFDK
jgi:hypothetical protein